MAQLRTIPAQLLLEHALGVAEGIALARALSRLPDRLHIYSIEAKTFEIGGEISAEIIRAANELARRIADFVSGRCLEIEASAAS